MKTLILLLLIIPALSYSQQGDIRDLKYQMLNHETALEQIHMKITEGTKYITFSAAVFVGTMAASYIAWGELYYAPGFAVLSGVGIMLGMINIYQARQELGRLIFTFEGRCAFIRPCFNGTQV